MCIHNDVKWVIIGSECGSSSIQHQAINNQCVSSGNKTTHNKFSENVIKIDISFQ